MGACDASGAASLGGGRIAVADDEDNRLRVYDSSTAGPPVEIVDTRPHLADARGKHPEMDLEAAATVGTRVYWIASHSRKKSGKRARSRLRLFATDLRRGESGAATLAVVGRPYELLLEDLVTAPALARFDLAAAAARPPNQPGGLNIEGLTDIPGTGHLLLAFRSPVPGARAILVPILNPSGMVERGEAAELGRPVELDLSGRGVRSIVSWGGVYWIVAGSPHGRAESRLYRWNGSGAPQWISTVRFGELNPEALAEVSVGARTGLLVLSDDGERDMGDGPCKHVKMDAAKQFRGMWLEKGP